MPIKTYRPTTQTLRYRTTIVNDDITRTSRTSRCSSPSRAPADAAIAATPPCGSLVAATSASCASSISSATRSAFPATVATIEYDPNRSARIALLNYADGEKRYILQPDGLKVGQKIVSGPDADILVGNALPLHNIPPGTTIHNVELKPGKGAQMVRSAGGAAQLVAKEGEYALVKLPSGETRKVAQGLHGDHRTGRQSRSRKHHHRQRPDALAGWESVRTIAAFP